MSERTWGYSNPVGEWVFRLQLAHEQRGNPIRIFFTVLRSAASVVAPMHRLRAASMSWGQYDAEGREQAFHELEDVDQVSWENLEKKLAKMLTPAAPEWRVAVSCLFLTLDTELVDGGRSQWADESAELQLSFVAPELDPVEASLTYSTAIDVWLPITLDAELRPRGNQQLSRQNLPRLQGMLMRLDAISSSSTTGQSKLYGSALGPRGFAD